MNNKPCVSNKRQELPKCLIVHLQKLKMNNCDEMKTIGLNFNPS